MSRLTNETIIYNFLSQICEKQRKNGEELGCTTQFISSNLNISRANVSHALNQLYNDGKVFKIKSRPVIFYINKNENPKEGIMEVDFDNIAGRLTSLKKPIKQAKAAIVYPNYGLHTLILGPTGVGKTAFAELMYKFALKKGILKHDSPFISFNCADYSSNPQLLLAHLFGAKKGAYTGADSDRKGLVEKADGGILFLDEVHRLPPEGQEMLFYLLDKGLYTPLGNSEAPQKANIRLICATTENKDSTLLSTFTRRIPMVIELPALKDRTFEERFELINIFFKNEARRLGREISVPSEAIKNLLLYNCTGNVGQLKNDIQLGCATAFLKVMTKEKKKLEIDISDFSDIVRRGILNYRQYKDEVEKIIGNNVSFTYSVNSTRNIIEEGSNLFPTSFYEEIERRVSELRKRNINDEDIKLIMSLDTERLMKKYIYKLNNRVNKEELSKIADSEIIEAIEKLLDFASDKLNRIFSQKIFCGLCLHVGAALERIREGKSIVNHKLQGIIENYPEEYAIAFHFAGKLQKKFGVKIPLDEVGYITMFLTDEYTEPKKLKNEPVILIAMHGKSTASSMAEVVNTLVGADNVYAYDMPLNRSVKEAYREIRDYIKSIHRGGGILLLTDMGSLSLFGDLISEETGIRIRSIDMITTPVALDCARKATRFRELDRIWHELFNETQPVTYDQSNLLRDFDADKNNIIITMCMTGEGSAVKLKKMIEEYVDFQNTDIQILPMEISNRKNMIEKINKIKETKNVLGIVGTVNPRIEKIPFISISEVFMNKDFSKIESLLNGITFCKGKVNNVNKEKIYREVINSLKSQNKIYDFDVYRALILDLLYELEQKFNFDIHYDVGIGIICHIASSIERLKNGTYVEKFKLKDRMNLKPKLCEIIKESFKPLENVFNVTFPEDEIYIIGYFLLPSEQNNF